MARFEERRPLDEQKDRAACKYRWIESGEERTKTCRYSRYAKNRRGWFSPFGLPAACSVGTNTTIRDGQNLACERNFVGKCADASGQGVLTRLRNAHTSQPTSGRPSLFQCFQPSRRRSTSTRATSLGSRTLEDASTLNLSRYIRPVMNPLSSILGFG